MLCLGWEGRRTTLIQTDKVGCGKLHSVLISIIYILDITLIGRFACQAIRTGAGKVEGDVALMLSGSSPGEELTTPGSCISLSQT